MIGDPVEESVSEGSDSFTSVDGVGSVRSEP